MTQTFKIALVQTSAQEDMQVTLERAAGMAREAAAQGADMLQFAEFFSCYHVDNEGIHTGPLPEEAHPALPLFANLAQELGVWFDLGSLTVPAPDGRAYNRQYVIDDQGIVRATYEKIHLFDVDLGGDDRYRESASLAPGERAVVTDTPWGRMGLSICYDVRFPQLFRDYAKAGAKILSIPAAFTRTTGQAHWHNLLRSRAIENGCYVIAAAQCGDHPGNRQTFGHSLIIDPWGEVLADAGTDPGFVTAEIDLDRVEDIRRMVPSLHNDRAYKPC